MAFINDLKDAVDWLEDALGCTIEQAYGRTIHFWDVVKRLDRPATFIGLLDDDERPMMLIRIGKRKYCDKVYYRNFKKLIPLKIEE